MDRGRLLIGIVWAVCAFVGPAWANDQEIPGGTELMLDLLEADEGESPGDVQPAVDCSGGRPDRDCLSGRVGASETTQTCGGISVLFGAGSCSVHCIGGYYACGKCGWGGFAMCTCRENFSCNPYAP